MYASILVSVLSVVSAVPQIYRPARPLYAAPVCTPVTVTETATVQEDVVETTTEPVFETATIYTTEVLTQVENELETAYITETETQVNTEVETEVIPTTEYVTETEIATIYATETAKIYVTATITEEITKTSTYCPPPITRNGLTGWARFAHKTATIILQCSYVLCVQVTQSVIIFPVMGGKSDSEILVTSGQKHLLWPLEATMSLL